MTQTFYKNDTQGHWIGLGSEVFSGAVIRMLTLQRLGQKQTKHIQQYKDNYLSGFNTLKTSVKSLVLKHRNRFFSSLGDTFLIGVKYLQSAVDHKSRKMGKIANVPQLYVPNEALACL